MANETPNDPKGTAGKTFPQLTDYGKLEQFSEVDDQRQHRNHRIYKRTPSAREVGDGEIVFSIVGNVMKIHTKLNGVVLSAVLT